MTEQFESFDASRHLDSKAVIAEYLAAAAETGDPAFILAATRDVARVRRAAL